MRILHSSRITQHPAWSARRDRIRFRNGMTLGLGWGGLILAIAATGAIWYRFEGRGIVDPWLRDLLLSGRNTRDALPTLYVEIGSQEVEGLAAQRDEALRTGILRREGADRVTAHVRFQDRVLPVVVWLPEGSTDRWQEQRWSFEMDVQGGEALLDMGSFSARPLDDGPFLNEWLYAQHLRDSGILATRCSLVNVSLNGDDWGLYVLRDLLTTEWLESQGRAPGTIVRLDERLLWERRAQLVGEEVQGQDLTIDPIAGTFELAAFAQVEEGSAFQGEDGSQGSEQAGEARGLLRAFQERQLRASQVFDPELLGRYLAHANLWGARYGLMWYNARFYYNPSTSLLEPIGHDALPLTPAYALFLDLAQYDDLAVMDAYAREVARISQPGYLESFRAVYANEFERYEAVLAPGAQGSEAPWDLLARRQALLRAALHPPQTVRAYEESRDSHSELMVRVGNLLRYPVVLRQLQIGDARVDVRPDWIVEPRRAQSDDPRVVHWEAADRVVLRRVQGDVPRYVTLRIPVDALGQLLPDAAPLDSWTMQIVTHLVGVEEEVTVDVRRDPPPGLSTVIGRMSVPSNSPSVQDVLAKHPFLVPGDRPGMLGVKAGTWHVQGDLILPAGFGLEATQPVTLTFDRQAMFLVRGPLLLHGPQEGGIHLVPRGDHWAGLIVYGAGPQAVSSLTHVEIRAATGVRREGWTTTGAATFYESPVVLLRCRLVDSMAQDAIHLVRTRFEIVNTEFGNVSGDALDVDQAQGRIERCAFHDVLGNGIDVSGSRVDVQDSRLIRIYDKAIAAGEGSVVTVQGVHVADAGVAVAGTDMSQVQVHDLHMSQVWLAGLAAYLRELAYGSSNVRATRLVSEGDVSILALAQPGNSIAVDGVEVGSSAFDVEALHWREPAPSGVRVLSYRFGSDIRLLGYELDASPVESGEPLRLVLYWQALAEIEREYTVFVHVLDASGQLVAQRDSMPRDNTLPTTHWLAGRVIDDPHFLALPQDLGAGKYRIAIGLYHWVTGERLSIQRLDGEMLPDGVLFVEPPIEVG
jgi:hypothetical protein